MNYLGWTPLHIATHKGHLDVIKILVESGNANILTKNEINGVSPLMIAFDDGNQEILQYFIQQMQN